MSNIHYMIVDRIKFTVLALVRKFLNIFKLLTRAAEFTLNKGKLEFSSNLE